MRFQDAARDARAIAQELKKYDEALKAAEEAKSFQPEGRMAGYIDGFRKKGIV